MLRLNRVLGSVAVVSRATLGVSRPVGLSRFARFYAYPSHKVEGLPALSPSMETGRLIAWKKKEGEKITAGDVLASVETDKATVDFEATDDGYVAKLLVEEGQQELTVGAPILVTVEDEADIGAFKDFKADSPGSAKTEEPAKPVDDSANKKDAASSAGDAKSGGNSGKGAKEETASSSKSTADPSKKAADPKAEVSGQEHPGSNVKNKDAVEPAAKQADKIGAPAEETGEFVAGVPPKLPKRERASAPAASSSAPAASAAAGKSAPAAAAPATGQSQDIPNSGLRKVIANRLTLSKTTIPHYYLTAAVNMDRVVKLRQELNTKAAGEYKLSVNDFVVKAAALALKKVPAANAQWNNEFIRRFSNIDINVAINTDRGLYSPLIKNADQAGLSQLNKSVKDLAEKAKANKLSPAELESGTFTISNLGMYGIRQFTAVINPPQACILAVGSIEGKVVMEGESFKTVNELTVTLSCDHRVVDGAIGAEWLQAFRTYIEDPIKMLL